VCQTNAQRGRGKGCIVRRRPKAKQKQKKSKNLKGVKSGPTNFYINKKVRKLEGEDVKKSSAQKIHPVWPMSGGSREGGGKKGTRKVREQAVRGDSPPDHLSDRNGRESNPGCETGGLSPGRKAKTKMLGREGIRGTKTKRNTHRRPLGGE